MNSENEVRSEWFQSVEDILEPTPVVNNNTYHPDLSFLRDDREIEAYNILDISTNLHLDSNKESNFTIQQHETELRELLSSWNQSSIADHLIKERVFIESLKVMRRDHIEQLLKDFLLGTRIMFEHNLYEWRKSIGIPLLSRQQMEMPFSVSVRPNIRPTSPSPSTSSLASVTSSEDGRFHPYKPNENNPEKNDIDLFTILSTSLKGSALVQYYNKYSQFQEEQRNVLIHVIAKHFDEMGVNLSLSNSYKIEKQILERFKNEKLEYYRCGKRGRIYNKYCNLKTSFGTAVDKYVKRKSPKMRQNGKRTEKVFEPEEDAAICLRSLTFDNLSAEEMDCTWKACVNYRMDDIKKCATTEEILKKWPFYKAPTGFRLIDMDFQFAYKNGDGLLEKWPTCRDKIIQFLLANVKEKSCRILIQKTKKDENLNEDVINANTMLALHGYFIPTSKIVIKDESGRNVTTKYTIKDSQDSFIYRAKSLQEFEDYLDHLRVAKKSIQPFVFIIDEKETYVYFDNIRYKFLNVLRAVDICFKIMYVFNLNFPPESIMCYSFIETYFYNLKGNYSASKIPILIQYIDAEENMPK